MIYYTGNIYLDKIPTSEEARHKILDWRNDYSIWKTCRQFDLISVQSHLTYLDKVTQPGSTTRLYAIHCKSTNEMVGVCGLTSICHINQKAEFSLYVSTDNQRQGYARDALKTLCFHGFQNLNLNRIWGEVFEVNSKALCMFKNLGFVQEGSLRSTYYSNGRFINSVIVSLIKADWERLPWKCDIKSVDHIPFST